MADLAALMLDINGPLSPTECRTPPRGSTSAPLTATGDIRHGVVTYSYGVTSHEHKQARLDAFRSLGDAYAPAPVKTSPEDVAYYKLMEAYERGNASRKAGESFADEYERQCLTRTTGLKKENSPKEKRDVCNSCLRPFDDGYYKPKAERGESDVSFDVELGTWKVHFSRNMEQEALYRRTEKSSATTKTAVSAPHDYPDGGYVDYHSHLSGSSRMTMPVRTKEAAGDVMADYDAFLRSNHVVVVPATTTAQAENPKPIAKAAVAPVTVTGDVMSDYDAFLRANHVVILPAASTVQAKKPKPTAAVAPAAVTKDVMAEYDEFLVRNHVVIMPGDKQPQASTAPAPSLAAQAAAAGDSMADYGAFLRQNHVVIMPAATSAEADKPEPKATAPTATSRDVMDEYEEFLVQNHVVIMPGDKPQSSKTSTVSLAEQAAAAGDSMANYAMFLRSNHVVVIPDRTKAEKEEEEKTPASATEVVFDEDEDEDMDYVEVNDEEYLDYLRDNHVVVETVKRTEVEKTEAQVTAPPVVNDRTTSYEKFYEFGDEESHWNVGPAHMLRLG